VNQESARPLQSGGQSFYKQFRALAEGGRACRETPWTSVRCNAADKRRQLFVMPIKCLLNGY
jgi:hypothetical protein